MRECPACKRTYKDGEAGHKLLLYDVEPTWYTGPRFWICEVTAEGLRGILAQFDKNTDPQTWHQPLVKTIKR